MRSQGGFARETSLYVTAAAASRREDQKNNRNISRGPSQAPVTDLKPITNHVQERPCNALVGVGEADHRGPQDVSDDPKSSNRSRLPERKRMPALPVRSSLSLKLCRFALWKSSSSSCQPAPDTLHRAEDEACRRIPPQPHRLPRASCPSTALASSSEGALVPPHWNRSETPLGPRKRYPCLA